uniref:Carboxypeptidase n=1 Tax=Parastrongyloides trichosuri TaxID=131310 RepID=A0A0N4ZGJ4_PARTI
MMIFNIITIFFSSLIFITTSAPYADKVLNLPYLNFRPNFDQYAGYIQALPTKQLFYWFVESQSNPSTDPVILWLQGGPGCSGMDGLTTEMGPYRVTDYGKTVEANPYSWNKIANMIFIDAPAGVGFSYALDNNHTYSDDEVADQNYNALKYFFNVKFPEFKSNDFYIMGESYGGTYVPMLSTRLIDDKINFPTFKGMAIGNGCLSDKLMYNSVIQFSYNHAFIDESYYRNAVKKCCFTSGEDCDFYQYSNLTPNDRCYNESMNLYYANFYTGLDPYFLYFSCYLDSPTGLFAHPHASKIALTRHYNNKFYGKPSIKSSSNPPACSHHDDNVLWLNMPEVRRALNVPALLPTYETCSDSVSNNYVSQYPDMTSFVIYAMDKGVRTMFFNGDVDSVCNVIHNKQFIANLNRKLIQPASVWNISVNLPPTAGFVTKYDGVDFVTVRGAGHFVASNLEKPREGLQLIYNFLKNQDYSTPFGQ